MMDRKLEWLTERPIAHRGLHDGRTRMENSLSAFEAAVEHGYAIECDVHPTSDGGVAVFHDNTLDRLTEAQGLTRERTMSELNGLQLAGTSDTIPSLEGMLKLVDGRVPIVLELKGFGPRQDGLVTAVAHALYGYSGNAAIMSFDQSLVRAFATDAPTIPCGLTAQGTTLEEMQRHETIADGVNFLSYAVNDLPNPFVDEFRASGRPVITWTVRTPDEIERTRRHADQMTFEEFLP